MKQLFIAIFISIATITSIHSQSTDATNTNVPTSTANPKDSITFHSKAVTTNPVISDLKENENLRKRIYTDDKFLIFELKNTLQKKSVFNSSYSKFIVPVVLFSYGIATQGIEELKELDRSTNLEITEHYTGRIYLDDYIQFAPAIAVYGLDWLGVKAKHNFRDRTIIMATSHLLMFATVQTMKKTIHIERPDGSNKKSFPSGHTATAFVGAHIFFKEYKDASPWIAAAGYTVATTTGVLRVVNKKHWVSDVVTGAGIGILSTELSYLLLPVFHNIFGIKENKSSLIITPTIGVEKYGVGLAYTF